MIFFRTAYNFVRYYQNRLLLETLLLQNQTEKANDTVLKSLHKSRVRDKKLSKRISHNDQLGFKPSRFEKKKETSKGFLTS